MKFTPTAISEVILIQPKLYSDERGFFMETYQVTRYSEAGIEVNFVQDNHSGSIQGTLRGMHYQIRHPQGKLVQIVTGEVYDVAVDLRRSSPTFGMWVGEKLSADNKLQLWIPPGFAHGFYVLSDWADVLYKVTEFYAPDWDRTLLWNDTALGIKWPLIDGTLPLLSEKDANGAPLKNADTFA